MYLVLAPPATRACSPIMGCFDNLAEMTADSASDRNQEDPEEPGQVSPPK